MDEQQNQSPANGPVIIAYIKRHKDPNTILFGDGEKIDDILKLFNDPFSARKKQPYLGEAEVNEGSCFEVSLSEGARDAMRRQYVTMQSQLESLKSYWRDGDAGLDAIRVIYSYDGTKLIFKRVRSNQILNQGHIVTLEREAHVSDASGALAIDSEIAAVYNMQTNRFYFIDFITAKHVFGSLELYYRSATQNDVDEWLDPSLFNVDDNFDTFTISTPNRKKMAYASEELGIKLEDAELLGRLTAYAGRHSPGGLFENGKFNIRSNADVTESLRVITGAYFQNEVTGDVMIAGSAKKAAR